MVCSIGDSVFIMLPVFWKW